MLLSYPEFGVSYSYWTMPFFGYEVQANKTWQTGMSPMSLVVLFTDVDAIQRSDPRFTR
jgi:hypothetical protein